MRNRLNRLYDEFNQRQYVHPDPLEFLYRYEDIRDREIAGLIASTLAYGRVAQILISVSRVLDVMGPSPFAYLLATTEREIGTQFQSFIHRFAKGAHLAALLIGIKQIIAGYGSVYACFMDGFEPSHDTVVPALTVFAERIINASRDNPACNPACGPGHLMPCPDKGSACKRLNLYLRWMIRTDAVDPGGWPGIPASKLIVPLDVHMFRICGHMGLTVRKQANLQAAVEITEKFRQWSPDDPVRYDFALTRFGIRNDLAIHQALTAILGA